MYRDIYIAIMAAAAKGKGMMLTVEEVYNLSRDEAIAGAAMNGLEENDLRPSAGPFPEWKNIDPKKKRTPANLR